MNDHGDEGMEWDDDCDGTSIALHKYEIDELLADWARELKLDNKEEN
tara:strand:+ start:1315 stop:1455 length:141 start_codon:yes stop_codon:yes gene_type:complete